MDMMTASEMRIELGRRRDKQRIFALKQSKRWIRIINRLIKKQTKHNKNWVRIYTKDFSKVEIIRQDIECELIKYYEHLGYNTKIEANCIGLYFQIEW